MRESREDESMLRNGERPVAITHFSEIQAVLDERRRVIEREIAYLRTLLFRPTPPRRRDD